MRTDTDVFKESSLRNDDASDGESSIDAGVDSGNESGMSTSSLS
jgi:hypothetical protein